MKRFEVLTPNERVIFRFPTSLKEIKTSYLKSVTNNIHVADNYSLIAIVYHETLGRIILTTKQSKKAIKAGVVPIFIKAGATDNTFIKKILTSQKLVIPSSSLMTAHHISCPENVLSLDKFVSYVERDITISARYNNNYGNEECFFIEFKVVPNCDIISYYGTANLNVLGSYMSIIPLDDSDDSDSSSSGDNDSSSGDSFDSSDSSYDSMAGDSSES